MTHAYSQLKQNNNELLSNEVLFRGPIVSTMPQRISFQTTTICNLSCPHCETHGTEETRKIYNDKSNNMELELLYSVAKEALPYADEYTLALNGEPLATPNVDTILKELSVYGAKLDLVTNGTTLNKQRLKFLIPYTSNIRLSIDGATPKTLEATRKGVTYSKLLNKIRLLTRSLELLPEQFERPIVSIGFIVMASNIRDLPVIVRLAADLRIKHISVSPVLIFFEHLCDEAIELHKSLYNTYYDRATEEAALCNIKINLPNKFTIDNNKTNGKIQGDNLILPPLDDAYYDSLPPLENILNYSNIDSDANEIVQAIVNNNNSRDEVFTDENQQYEESQAMQLNSLPIIDINSVNISDSQLSLKYCEYLYRQVYISADGSVVPCCIPGRPILGNVISEGGLANVWKNEAYQNFRKRFISDEPFDCCKDCRYVTHLSRRLLEANLHSIEHYGWIFTFKTMVKLFSQRGWSEFPQFSHELLKIFVRYLKRFKPIHKLQLKLTTNK